MLIKDTHKYSLHTFSEGRFFLIKSVEHMQRGDSLVDVPLNLREATILQGVLTDWVNNRLTRIEKHESQKEEEETSTTG